MDEQIVISKTQRKRDSHALQKLGEQLTELTQEQLAELALPEQLLDAVVAAKTITKFGALRRQLQYIGRLMHQVDGNSIAARLDAWKGQSRAEAAHLHLLERWRTRLLDDETALNDLAAAYPACDTQRVRELVRGVQRERVEGKPPRSYRALFQELRRVVPNPLDNATA